MQQSILAVDDLFHLRGTCHAQDDGIRAFGQFLAIVGLDGAGGEQVVEAGPVAVRHEAQRMALGQQVARHAMAHHAQADECDCLFHVVVFSESVAQGFAINLVAWDDCQRQMSRR